jgi:DNA-binding beta-propeller fold protein YncE
MMSVTGIRRKSNACWPRTVAGSVIWLLTLAAGTGMAQGPSRPGAPVPPTRAYWVYVGAESADLVHRVRFGPDGAAVEKTIEVGELVAEMEGPHGLQISSDGKYLHLTTGHGFPDGKYWRYELGPDTLVGPGLLLGNFPASIDVTPDGLYTFSVNYNLHGDMVPSSVSVVHTPSLAEVARIVTCVMPHGSRFDPQGLFHYSGCMMDDMLVEIDTRTFEVSRRFSLAKGKEGPLPAEGDETLQMWIEGARTASQGKTADPADVGYAAMGGHKHAMTPNTCSPTWAQPSVDGRFVYVACNKADEIVEVDRTAWQVTRRFATGRGPYNIAVTPDGTRLVATLKQGGMFEVFDLATGRSLTRLQNSTTVAHGVTVSPDSRYAFVSSEGVGAAPGKVDIYDLTALVRVGSVDVGQQAGGIAFWKLQDEVKR